MTTDHLYNSAIQCKKDDIQGVTECIVMGTQVPIGTGMFKVCYDDTVKPDENASERVSKSPNKRTGAKGGRNTVKKDYLKPIVEENNLLFDSIH